MAGKHAIVPPTPQTLALYDKLVATTPGVERKGVTLPYTSLNGSMFSFITSHGGLAIRLSAEDKAAFEAKYKTKPVVQHGAVMKEYVAVPDALLKKTAELKAFWKKSVAYAKTLKPGKKR
jgi:hypothetical protein